MTYPFKADRNPAWTVLQRTTTETVAYRFQRVRAGSSAARCLAKSLGRPAQLLRPQLARLRNRVALSIAIGLTVGRLAIEFS